MSNSSIWPIDRTLSSATTPSLSGPGSFGNEGVLHIPQISDISTASPSDCLVSYTQDTRCMRGSYPCAEMQSVYSTAPADWNEFRSVVNSCWPCVRLSWISKSPHGFGSIFSELIQQSVTILYWASFSRGAACLLQTYAKLENTYTGWHFLYKYKKKRRSKSE